jgi:hypothetical protein
MDGSSAIQPVAPRATALPARLLYGAAVFLGALLLFLVQLVVSKHILPWFGGAPAVWNTSMLVFQALLLGGYLYAHVISSRLRPRTQAAVHLLLLATCGALLLILSFAWPSPITPGEAWKPGERTNPVLGIVGTLCVSVAFPFLLLASTSPLLQRWFSLCGAGREPYRLYALSNAGSLAGLLCYPFLLERVLTVRHQGWLWSACYGAFSLATAAVALSFGKGAPETNVADCGLSAGTDGFQPRLQSAIGNPQFRRALWLALPACASVALLATTNLICQEVPVTPVLWVLPLCLYLLSFIICFDSPRWYRREIFHPLYLAAVFFALVTSAMGALANLFWQLLIYSSALFVVCMVCHGELARLKPAPRYLTPFYVAVSLGGALGGMLVVLAAPLVFHNYWEFQISLIGCGVLLFAVLVSDRESWFHEARPWLAWAVILGLLMLIGVAVRFLLHGRLGTGYYATVCVTAFFAARAARRPAAGVRRAAPLAVLSSGAVLAVFTLLLIVHWRSDAAGVRVISRNFFGVKKVFDQGGYRILRHGRIVHGQQSLDPARRGEPTSYYARDTGINLLLTGCPRTNPLRVGVVGLGTGTLAAYGQPGDYYRFYEIDPDVTALSRSESPEFTFLRDSRARVEVIAGDARLALERELRRRQPQQFDVLVLDAFSSDSIPVHLLTREAFRIYVGHLRGPDSVLAVHISNRFLDLALVVAGLAADAGLNSAQVKNAGADWVLLSRRPAMLRLPGLRDHAQPVALDRPPRLWTDDFSNIFQALKR